MSVLIKNIILNGQKKDIYIEKGKISKIKKNLNLKAKEVIDGKNNKAVLPPLINAHTHSAMVLLRGYGDDLFLKEWLEKKIWPVENKFNEDDIYWGTKLACLEMIKTGTVFFNEMYMFPGVAMKATEEMRIRALIGMVVIDLPYVKNVSSIEDRFKKLKTKQTERVNLSIAPHAVYTVCKKNLIWVKKFSQKNNLIIHTHISETKKEVDYCLKKYRLRPVEFLDKIKFLSKNTVLAHGVWLSSKEIEILAKRKCSLVFNPVSNLKLSVGKIFPYEKIKKAGINILLGTDGSASNNNLDMFEEMKFAGLIQKHQEKNPTAMPAQEVFNCATKNGASVFNLNNGEIKEGKSADLILINLNEVSLVPGHNLISDIVYSASGNIVSDLICNGEIVMRNRKVKNEKEIIKTAKKRALNVTYGPD